MFQSYIHRCSLYNITMRENDFIETIKNIIGDKYIGDDCAFLKDLGIVVSQDSLVEDVHFSLEYTTPYKLGYKSAMVNISDISASGGEGKYMTVALSLPKNTENDFVEEFYKGLKDACQGIEIIGSDITGSDKIMISVTIIGTTNGRKISSRANAKEGQVVVTSGVHGSSAGGLKLLQENKNLSSNLVEYHLMPKAQVEFSEKIAKNIKEDYAMMDSSDGLADALYKIAKSSDKTLVIDFKKILFDKELKEIFPDDYKNLMLYGGEDYQIIATVPEDFAKTYGLNIIGRVETKIENTPVKIINFNNGELVIDNLEKCFNHF